MKRFLISIFSILVGSLLFAAPASANVNNFYISSYDIDYVLSRDDQERSILEVTESITAEFPMRNQNRGIERFIPDSYDGHPVQLKVLSVKDANQSNWNYTTYDSDGQYTVVRIGDSNRYVQGRQTYVIKYTQRDVTKSFSDTGVDEFYWDTNGTAWSVPIRSLNVSLRVEEDLADALSGEASCYSGSYGSQDQCEISQSETTFTTSATNLPAGGNVTLAVAFEPGTFAAYEQSWLEKAASVWVIIQGLLTAVSFGLIWFLASRYGSWSRRKKEIGTIVPEYLPPKDSSVSLSGALLGLHATFAAQLIDLAVRHYIKIYEKSEAKLLSPAVYEFEIIRPIDDLREEEKEFLRDVFKDGTSVGAKVDTNSLKKDNSLSMRLMDNPTKIRKLKRTTYDIKQKSPEKSAWFKKFGTVVLVLSLVLLSPPLLVVAIISLVMSSVLWVLTDKGLELYRYLEGLKLYISVAEEERLKMLQSPEGAQKVQTETDDPRKLVKLYERVLPYAVLFGQEKEWNKHLGSYYESTGSQPDWYSGANLAIFNAAAFSSAMSNLNTSINSTGASYSSSGGSSGGGFSGGGGGGGGGGGW